MIDTSPAVDGEPSLLAVFAHPDDESLATGGLLALAAARGMRVSVLCLTRGGLGLPGDPQLTRIGDARVAELQSAASVLGIEDVCVLDYRNGFLPWADRASILDDVQAAIRRVAATVVVTFDEDGLYWHPDHIVVHECVTAAVMAMEATAPALYYVTLPRGRMRAAVMAAAAQAVTRGEILESERVLGVEADAFGLFANAPTLRLDVSAVADRKLAALRCHQSQIAGDALDRLPPNAVIDVLGLETYRRAGVGANGRTLMDELGQAIETT